MKEKFAAIPAGEFKAKCLSILNEVEREGRSFVVTKHGRPVARVVPLPRLREALFGSVAYDSDVDLLSPIDVAWASDDADKPMRTRAKTVKKNRQKG